jgi:spore coat assembly protein SafA
MTTQRVVIFLPVITFEKTYVYMLKYICIIYAEKQKGNYIKMKKFIAPLMIALQISVMIPSGVSANTTHKVVSGDSMWKIAVKYEVGLSEIKAANPHIKNPDLIYPGQTLNIPTTDASVLSFEKEVVRLANEKRKHNGLSELTYDWQLSRVARIKSEDMRDNKYFSHTSPIYGTPFQMMKNFAALSLTLRSRRTAK